jgi:hypothetical protein
MDVMGLRFYTNNGGILGGDGILRGFTIFKLWFKKTVGILKVLEYYGGGVY